MAEFAKIVSTMRGGADERAASAALAKVVEAVRATGNAGSVSIKLTIKPLSYGYGYGGDEIEVEAQIGLTLPTEDFDPKDADWEKAAAFCAKWLRDHGYDPESAS